MATITYSNAEDVNSISVVNVKITPASDGEIIYVPLGWHPNAITGIKEDGSGKVAFVYWNPMLATATTIVGYDFIAADDSLVGTFITNSISLYGPTPLVGVGVSKERIVQGFYVFGTLVETGIDLIFTCVR